MKTNNIDMKKKNYNNINKKMMLVDKINKKVLKKYNLIKLLNKTTKLINNRVKRKLHKWLIKLFPKFQTKDNLHYNKLIIYFS